MKFFLLIFATLISTNILAVSVESLSASITYYAQNCEQLSLAGKKKDSELQEMLGGFLDRTRNKKLTKELEYWERSYSLAEVLNIKEQVCVEHKEKLGHNYDVYFLLSLAELKDKKMRSLMQEIQAEEDKDREVAQEDILNELKVNYINQIASRVKNQWRYQGAKDHWGCDVHILQDVDGNVQSMNIQSCNIDNNAKAKSFKNAIERAVYKASPLPPAPDKSVFSHEILFHFRVN
jgi:hypothetical protein